MRRVGANNSIIDEVVWIHADPVSGSSERSHKSGAQYYRTEYEPLGNQEVSVFGLDEDFPEPQQFQGETAGRAEDPQWLCQFEDAISGGDFFALPVSCQIAKLENINLKDLYQDGNPAQIGDDSGPGQGDDGDPGKDGMSVDPTSTDKPQGGASGEEEGAIPESSNPTNDVDLEKNIVTVRDNSVPGFIDASYGSNRRNNLTPTQALKKIEEGVDEANKLLGKKTKKEEDSCKYFIETQLGLGEGSVDKIKELLANSNTFDVSGRNEAGSDNGKEVNAQAKQSEQKIYVYRQFFSVNQVTTTSGGNTKFPSRGSNTPSQKPRSPTNRGQILIHEALHLLKAGNTDVFLANKAKGKEEFEDTEKGRAKASEYLQNQVEKYCDY